MAKSDIIIGAKTKGAESNLRRVKKQYDNIKDSANQAAKAAARVPRYGRGGPKGMSGRERTSGTLEAIGRSGGAAGGAFGQIASALGGKFAALGVAAAAAGLALNAAAAASRRAAEQAKQTVELQHKITNTLRAVNKAADAASLNAVQSERANLRKLVGRAGDGARALVNTLKKQGVDDASGGLVALMDSKGKIDQRALAAARQAAATGQIDFSTAAGHAKNRRFTGDQNADAASLLQAESGRRTTASDVNRFLRNMRGRTGHMLTTIDRVNGQASAATLDRGLDGGALRAAGRARDAAVDPEKVAMKEIRRDLRQAVEAMQASAQASNAIAEVMSQIGRAAGLSEGSYAQRANDRLDVIEAAGVNL